MRETLYQQLIIQWIYVYQIYYYITMTQERTVSVILESEPIQIVRNFNNPICKETFDSLPKIYGNKKKKTKIIIPDQKQLTKKNYFSSMEKRQQSTQKKRVYSSGTQLSKPKHHKCFKRSCYCNSKLDSDEELNKKLSKVKLRKPVLPQIRKFQLQDLESSHKVAVKKKQRNSGIGLQNIIQQRLKNEQTQDFGLNNKNKMKQMQKFKPKFNKFQIQEEEEDEESQEHEVKKGSARFKTSVNGTDSPKSSNFSLSSYILNGLKKQNTRFHALHKSENNKANFQIKRKASQLSNGLFRIPEEAQFQDYLTTYNPLNPSFQILDVAKKPTFRVIKEDKGVYFGQVNKNNAKHGNGLTVTERQIYQGTYNNNVKITGCERNIDGVYTGEFINGLRQGFGVFKWNNGQTYEGSWVKGVKQGRGIWKSPAGDYCQGEWKKNRQHGKGLFKHKNSTYKGNFVNSLKDGEGQEYFSNGDKYEGFYKEGKPSGKGRYEWKSGGYYEGFFLKGLRQGKGVWVDSNGTCYEGQFKQDFKHGKGIQTYKTKQRFEGQFFKGAKVEGRITDGSTNIEVK